MTTATKNPPARTQREERERDEDRQTTSTKATAAADTANEEEEEELPDERDRAELEEARQADSQRGASSESQEEEVPEEPEDEPEEIVALRAAFQRVQDKIDWHTQEIEKHREEIKEHETQTEELKDMLRTKFGGLVGSIGGMSERRGPGRPAQGQRKPQPQQGSRARTNYGDGNSTGDLIAACLKRAKKPVNTETLVAYLEQHGNNTNPSVELSRMVKKGLVERPSRGYYEWVGGE